MIDADHWVSEDFILGAINVPIKCLNTGFMVDTSKGNKWSSHGISINKKLIDNADQMTFTECMKLTGINGPQKWQKVWLASYPSDIFLSINGYDEKYIMGYGREDDSIYFRLASKLPTYYDNFSSFCGVHLWHEQKARDDVKNALNKIYYSRSDPKNAISNINHEWGKFIAGSTSNINGINRDFWHHEEYIESLGRVKSYQGSKPWKSFQHLQSCITN